MPGSPDLHAALLLAAKRHAGQDREGEAPLPYLDHVMEVLRNLRCIGGVTDPASLCAAALHDVVEHAGVRPALLRREFGDEVAGLVAELTRREPSAEAIEGMGKDEVWLLRADMLLKDVEQMSSRSACIKLADRLSNQAEARRTKRGQKLARYTCQSTRILGAIPRETNPGLWDALASEIGATDVS